MRTEWAPSDFCDHIATVCLSCCTPAERAALDLAAYQTSAGASAPVAGPVVYLLHFATPYPNGKHPQHYIGQARDLRSRLAMHRAGAGARLLAVIGDCGIDWHLARTWPNSPGLERRLKNYKKGSVLCPVCRQGRQVALPLEMQV